MIRIPAHVRHLGVCQFPDELGRASQYKSVGWILLSLGYEGSGTDQGTGPDLDTAQYDGTHTYQAIISDCAGVEDRPVADRDVLSDQAGCISIDVHYSSVLNVCGFADLDRSNIRAGDGGKPDGRVVACTDSASDFRVPGNENVFTQNGDGIADRMDHRPFLIATG